MTIELQQGAVFMLDALGFKGIWERFPAFDINALDTLRATAINAAQTRSCIFTSFLTRSLSESRSIATPTYPVR